MKIRRGGVTRDLVNGYIFYLGARRRLQTIKQMRGGSLVTIASFIQPLTASANDRQTREDTTLASTCTVSGGIPSYSYVWSKLSGVSATINSPNMASTTFTFTGEGSAIFQVTVTDGQGTVATATMTATWLPPVDI